MMIDARVPVIADADTGVGGLAMCACTTTLRARTGVAGLLIEDQVKQKCCGRLASKQLVPLDEYLVRIHAALGSDIVLITRSNAPTPLGLRLSRTCGPAPEVATSRVKAHPKFGRLYLSSAACSVAASRVWCGHTVPGNAVPKNICTSVAPSDLSPRRRCAASIRRPRRGLHRAPELRRVVRGAPDNLSLT
ncbi:Pyruvate/Phosphoenolpyruvate kinase-like domain-containing protein [Mycena sp. CBHHK59/15]|nr:Pyruvate/Phosphoenolpyruvate kinase-like domain-containing protein [Mycena sp. CBHHK59/15]